jgi:hypothetical protein
LRIPKTIIRDISAITAITVGNQIYQSNCAIGPDSQAITIIVIESASGHGHIAATRGVIYIGAMVAISGIYASTSSSYICQGNCAIGPDIQTI